MAFTPREPDCVAVRPDRAEDCAGELMNAPVHLDSAEAVRSGLVGELKRVCRVGEVEADGEADEVGQRAAEDGEFSVEQQ